MLRFRIAGGGIDYQPVLCDDNAAALAAARCGLELRPDVEMVDVLLGDTEILQLGRAD